MLNAHQPGFISRIFQHLRQMDLSRIQIIGKSGMAESHHSVGMGVTSGPESCAGRATSRRSTKTVFKSGIFGCESIDIRSAGIRNPVTAQVLPEIMADYDQKIEAGLNH